jgi:hypothetical protein
MTRFNLKKVKVKAPLRLLPYQAGSLIISPLRETAGGGQQSLDGEQTAVVLGEPVPIVFCRRIGGAGGVLVSPKATEGRYSNSAFTNTLTVRLQLVLSEGNLPKLKLRDVFQRVCRVGTWKQTYNRRAGSWTPGNFITTVSGFEKWDCPVYCGTSGTYENLSMLSYTNQFGSASTNWDKQVHCFVRQGMQVTRIIDSTFGPSNNFVDLALYLINQSSRLPSDLIDNAAMLTAAQFTNAAGFYFNGLFDQSSNLDEWLQEISTYYLLRLVDKGGKKAFIPRLPINEDYTIKTTAISWVFAFTEEHILPDGFQIEYTPLADRKPICAQVLWRQQPDDDIGLIRTTEIRMAGTAATGPFEQYDMSQFCATENHAVKMGAYIVARRKYVSHTLRIKVKPDAYNGTLLVGDIVRVQLQRITDADISLHDYLYEVERISRSIEGIVELDLTHFPIDNQNRSLIAQEVAVAVGSGYNLPTGRDDFSCDDEGRRTDETDLEDEGGNLPLPNSGNFQYAAAGLTGSQPVGGINNPADPVNQIPDVIGQGNITDNRPQAGQPLTIGDTLNLVPPCANGKVDWYRKDKATGSRSLIKSDPLGDGWQDGSNLSMTTDEMDYIVEAEASCPDPSSPTGFGSPTLLGSVEPVLNCGENRYITAPTCTGTGEVTGGFATANTQASVTFNIPAIKLPGRVLKNIAGAFAQLYYLGDDPANNIVNTGIFVAADDPLIEVTYSGITCSTGSPEYSPGPCESP